MKISIKPNHTNSLKIYILTQEPGNYSNQNLIKTAIKRGHSIECLETRRVYMGISQANPTIEYGGKSLLPPPNTATAIIPRIGAQLTQYGAALVRQFEMAGTASLTSANAIINAQDKFLSHQILARHHIPCPPTAFAKAGADNADIIRLVGGAPVVIKLLSGSQGRGVVLANTAPEACAIMDGYRALYADMMVQAYVREASGSDIRALVINGQVVGAIKRTARDGEFRSNLHIGGTATPVELTAEEKDIAIKATQALGLTMAGIDLLRSRSGPLVLEANASPGLEGIQIATGVDIAKLIIQALEDRVAGVI